MNKSTKDSLKMKKLNVGAIQSPLIILWTWQKNPIKAERVVLENGVHTVFKYINH